MAQAGRKALGNTVDFEVKLNPRLANALGQMATLTESSRGAIVRVALTKFLVEIGAVPPGEEAEALRTVTRSLSHRRTTVTTITTKE